MASLSTQEQSIQGQSEIFSDAALLARFVAKRDEAAFKILVEKHTPLILSVCRRILVNEHDVEDAFQATFMVLAKNAKSIRISDSIVTWLFTVAQRISRRAVMARIKRRESELPQEIYQETEVFKQIHDQELVTSLYEEIEKLPHKYRQPILLCYIQGMSQAEASKELCCTVDSLKARLARGRKMLRGFLHKRGTMLGVALAVTVTSSFLSSTATAATPATTTLVNNTVSACLAYTASGKTAALTSSTSYMLAQGTGQMLSTTAIRIISTAMLSTATAALLLLGLQYGQATVLASTYEKQIQATNFEDDLHSVERVYTHSFVAEKLSEDKSKEEKSKAEENVKIREIKLDYPKGPPNGLPHKLGISKKVKEITLITSKKQAIKILGEKWGEEFAKGVNFRRERIALVLWSINTNMTHLYQAVPNIQGKNISFQVRSNVRQNAYSGPRVLGLHFGINAYAIPSDAKVSAKLKQ